MPNGSIQSPVSGQRTFDKVKRSAVYARFERDLKNYSASELMDQGLQLQKMDSTSSEEGNQALMIYLFEHDVPMKSISPALKNGGSATTALVQYLREREGVRPAPQSKPAPSSQPRRLDTPTKSAPKAAPTNVALQFRSA